MFFHIQPPEFPDGCGIVKIRSVVLNCISPHVFVGKNTFLPERFHLCGGLNTFFNFRRIRFAEGIFPCQMVNFHHLHCRLCLLNEVLNPLFRKLITLCCGQSFFQQLAHL